MNRIIEAFTRAPGHATIIDILILAAVILSVVVIVFSIFCWIMNKLGVNDDLDET